LFCNNILGGEYRIQTIDSKANKLIQAADLLCGYISRCFRDDKKYSNIEESISFFYTLNYMDYMLPNIVLIDYLGNIDLHRRIALLSGNSINIVKRDVVKILLKNYRDYLK